MLDMQRLRLLHPTMLAWSRQISFRDILHLLLYKSVLKSIPSIFSLKELKNLSMIFISGMRVSKKFRAGDLAKIVLRNRSFTSDGFSTFGQHPSPSMGVLYEHINIQTYPSARDFLGQQISVSDEQECIILNYFGRPMQITETVEWEQYDVYEVLVDGYTCHIFSFNLEAIDDKRTE
jgi:hypothetical protein